MKVEDEKIPEDMFSEFLTYLPRISVELFLETEEGVLLAKRNNKPLRGEWFCPGSRLYKGEELQEAAYRVAREELGVGIEVKGLLGVYSHFWDEAELEDVDEYHTVNVVFHVSPEGDPADITLDEQHEDYVFFSEARPEFHEYVKRYMRDSGLFE